MQSIDAKPLTLNDEATTHRDARAKVGTTLRGKWHLNALIAVGGMGAVYDATHRNGMHGAVKILDPRLGLSEDCRRRFLSEGKLANQVHHAGAVQVLDDDEAEDGSAYLVMELLHGETLETLASRAPSGRMDPAEAIGFGLQVIDTLHEAHASGIVHRDIKPENLFLTTDGVVKVLDFGIAGLLSREQPSTVTHEGETIGTPAFMSPEQARGRWELVDHQSDLYSLSASLFTLMTGRLVHASAGTVCEMLVLAITEEPTSLRAAMPDVPDAVVRAVDGALKLDKSARFADAAAMRVALEEAYVELTGNPAPAPRSIPPRPAARSVRPPERLQRMIQTTLQLRRLPSLGWMAAIAGVMGLVIITLVSAFISPRGVASASTERTTQTQAVSGAGDLADNGANLPTLGGTSTSANAASFQNSPASQPATVLRVATPSPQTAPVATTSSVVTPPSASAQPRHYNPLYDRRN